MKTIKLYFSDFWNGFNPSDNFFIQQLQLNYNVILDSVNPDYLIYSWNGNKHYRYKNAIKIYFTGENDVPDFNECDYAIGFQPIRFNDRYLRMPLYVLYDCFPKLSNPKQEISDAELLNRDFCSFVVSNAKGADPMREYFFMELSKYKRIDSGGKYLNNIGGPVKDKYEFIRKYKFNLAFENSLAPGYTTEKLLEPLTENTVPVYWGNPEVDKDFNKEAFVFVNDFETTDKAIQEIIRLDNDDEAYLRMVRAQPITNGHKNHSEWLAEYNSFVSNIFNPEKKHAVRMTAYGFSRFRRNRNRILTFIGSLPIIKTLIGKLSYK